MSGRPSPKQSSSSGEGSAENYTSPFVRNVEQLIDSDDQQIISRRLIQLHSAFPVLKKINNFITNQEKLIIFMRDFNFKHKLNERLKSKLGIQKLPIIKIQLYTVRYRSTITEELDQNDLLKIFSKFGNIVFIWTGTTEAFLQFQNISSAYMAIQALNQFEISVDSIRLCVRWCKLQEQNQAENLFFMKFNSQFSNLAIIDVSIPNNKTQKYTCKYDIYLQCSQQFKVSQRIIGPKGNNMKKIFDQVLQKYKAFTLAQVQGKLKLRLRGKGSGYKQGPNTEQSQELLNLCISSKQKDFYDLACIQTQKLLEKVTKDYKFQFQKIHRRSPQGFAFKKLQLSKFQFIEVKQFRLQQIQSILNWIIYPQQGNIRMKQDQIEAMILNRNKARKNGRFRQADDIRQHLKKSGVILIDEKNKGKTSRGTGLNNTTWKYIDE